MHTDRTARTSLTLVGAGGGRLALVAAGGGYHITRDGLPLPGCNWDGDGFDQCLIELARLAGLLDGPPPTDAGSTRV